MTKMQPNKSNVGHRNNNCLICKKQVNDTLFCDKCREKDVFMRIKAFKNSRYFTE